MGGVFTQGQVAGVLTVCALIVLDWASGLAKAAASRQVSSSAMRKGLWHKAGEVLVMVAALVVDVAQHWLDLGFTVPVTVAACIYISLMEVSSILENACSISPDLDATRLGSIFASSRSEPRHADTGGIAGSDVPQGMEVDGEDDETD